MLLPSVNILCYKLPLFKDLQLMLTKFRKRETAYGARYGECKPHPRDHEYGTHRKSDLGLLLAAHRFVTFSFHKDSFYLCMIQRNEQNEKNNHDTIRCGTFPYRSADGTRTS